MSRLILIKHAMPDVIKTRPAAEWELSAKGRESCLLLGEHLRTHAPQVMITSQEPKARQTGEIAASVLGIPVQAEPGLHEHERKTVPWFDDYALHTARLLRLFDEPDQVVFGEESANEATIRFDTAIRKVLERFTGKTVAVASHGTVISLFAQHRAGIEPKALWEQLKMPSFVVFRLPDFQVEKVVGDLTNLGD